ncbi:MAG: hypothetical protein QXV08_08680 [Desulfurococcus sp.]|uniref:hypothetical protein n=1 Tax=Desulfurococcus sp. TaxID=51678 RepID=UPI003171988E
MINSQFSTINIREVLSDDKELSKVVRQLLDLKKDSAENLLRRTTSTAYRRIYEHLTSVLDRATVILSKPEPNDISEIIIGLSKGLILIEYQFERNEINQALSIELKKILTNLLDSVEETNAIKKFERARTLLDALTVLVYKYAR